MKNNILLKLNTIIYTLSGAVIYPDPEFEKTTIVQGDNSHFPGTQDLEIVLYNQYL